MLEREEHVADADWRQYERTIDAIETREPQRMSPNGMDMLRAKVMQVRDDELQADAWRAYMELEEKAEGLA